MKRGLMLSLLLPLAVGGLSADNEPASSRSAFVRSFAQSSVDWVDWGPGAFEQARVEDKPVFLFMGSFTSELSRAMRDQSFEQTETVTLLNENFICVLVDLHEQPGLAAWYQAWLRSDLQLRGWPLNVWLTPELKPFDGANYLPPSDEWGNIGFLSKLKQVLTGWTSDPEGMRRKADRSLERFFSEHDIGPAVPLDASIVSEVVGDFSAEWMSDFDAVNGGFGLPPLHPRPELLRSFLLSADAGEREAALQSLRSMATMGLRDPLDGGFFRYASDSEWRVPYMQKTLSDQARMALAYLDAALLTEEALYSGVAAQTLGFALGLGEPGMGFVAALDSTLDSVLSGYLWSYEDIRKVLGREQTDLFCEVFAVSEEGNLPADAYLNVDSTGLNLPRGFDESGDLDGSLRALLEARGSRSTPLRDSSAGSGTLGLLLSAFSRGGNELERDDLTAAAESLAGFIRQELVLSSGLLRAGTGLPAEGTARDYLLVSEGLLTHADIVGDTKIRELGLALAGTALRRFSDPDNGRFLTSDESESPGIWGRVPLPVPDTSDLPGADAAFLMLDHKHRLSEALGVGIEAFTASMVDDMEMSAEPPTGDKLLALRLILQKNE